MSSRQSRSLSHCIVVVVVVVIVMPLYSWALFIVGVMAWKGTASAGNPVQALVAVLIVGNTSQCYVQTNIVREVKNKQQVAN